MAKQNKPAPEETGAELKKESTASDVMNANETAEFSKTEDKATEGRVNNTSDGDGKGSSDQTADADIAAREQQLEARETELKTREEAIIQKESDLEKAYQELKANEKSEKDNLIPAVGPEVGASNQTADADIAAREKVLAEREKEVALREEKVSVKEAEVLEVAKPAKAVEFTFEGEKYVFDKHAPQSIRTDDGVFTQKEIAKNEEILLSLIGGNSSLIKKL